MRATDERTGGAASEEETKPERVSVMTLAGDGGGARRRRRVISEGAAAAASRVCFHVVSSQIRRNEMRVRQADKRRTDGRGGGGSGREALISL